MAGSTPVATSAFIMRLRMPLFVLVLLLLGGQLHAAEQSPAANEATAAGTPPPARPIKPTRESIYSHLTAEMEAALGAEEHVKDVFTRLVDGLRQALSATVIPSLQAMVDTVLQKAEDTWVAADDAGQASAVRPCVDGAEHDAQQVAKRALEKAEGCIQALEDEGQRRFRQAARLFNEIEDVSKRFVTALETCIKEEQAKEAAQPPAEDAPAPAAAAPAEPEPATAPAEADTEVAVTEGPGKCPKATSDGSAQEAADAAGEKPARCPHSKGEAKDAGQGEAAAEEGAGPGQKKKLCAKCKKAQEDAAKKVASGDVSQEEPNTLEETDNLENAEQREGKSRKENKSKKGKEKDNKGKDKSSKVKKEDSAKVEESVDAKGPEKNKEKGKDKSKNKKVKDGEASDKPGKENEKAEKKSKGSENEETSHTEELNGDVKEKKEKKQDKREGKGKKDKSGETGESKKGRKKRHLLSVNEEPDAAAQSVGDSATTNSQEGQTAEGSPQSAASGDPWPTEGSTPEERRVIACLRSATMQPLLEEKTRVYQRLQGVLQRTADKEREAPTCVDEHVHKAELKIAAIKQRMASCADRKMRQEL